MKEEPVWVNEVVNDKSSTALDTCFSGQTVAALGSIDVSQQSRDIPLMRADLPKRHVPSSALQGLQLMTNHYIKGKAGFYMTLEGFSNSRKCERMVAKIQFPVPFHLLDHVIIPINVRESHWLPSTHGRKIPTHELSGLELRLQSCRLRKKLNITAPYIRTCSQISTLPLLRARCQNLTHLRSNLYDKTDTTLPYRGIPCLRCNPTALLDQGPLLIHTHHQVDNIHLLATSCVAMRDQQEQIGHQLEGIMVQLGIRPQEWAKVSEEENKISLTLASDPPAEWQLRKKTVIALRDHAMPYCAASL